MLDDFYVGACYEINIWWKNGDLDTKKFRTLSAARREGKRMIKGKENEYDDAYIRQFDENECAITDFDIN